MLIHGTGSRRLPDALLPASGRPGATASESTLKTDAPLPSPALLGALGESEDRIATASRRSFLKVSGIAAASLAGGAIAPLVGPIEPVKAMAGGRAVIAGAAASGTFVKVNVNDLGAMGDGVTDDRAAIQAALDSAGVGGTVFIPPGDYLLKSMTIPGDRILRAYKDQTIRGEHRNGVRLRVGDRLGAYRTIIGMLTDASEPGEFAVSGIQFDLNSMNGNAFVRAEVNTGPRNVIRTLSYAAGSVLSVTECTFDNASNLNTLYVAADSLDISRNFFTRTGLAGVKTWHDHSSIYSTVTVEGGTQVINGNTFRGNSGSGGSVCAIETHGGAQTVTGNVISGYQIGANLTGWSQTVRARSISCIGNTIDGCLVGIQLWSRYAGTITDGPGLRNVIVNSNPIIVDRDSWIGIAGLSATGWGIAVEAGNTAPIDGLTISNNTIEYAKSVGVPPPNDSRSIGIRLAVTSAHAALTNVRVTDNTIINPLSSGMIFAAVIKVLTVSGNTVFNPAQSAEMSVTSAFRSFAVITGTVHDANFDANVLVDNRAKHRCSYMMIALSSMTAAVNVSSRNNIVRFADGTRAPVTFCPSSASGCAPYISDQCAVWPGVFQPVKAGSTMRETSTGRLYTQTVVPTGTKWVVTGP